MNWIYIIVLDGNVWYTPFSKEKNSLVTDDDGQLLFFSDIDGIKSNFPSISHEVTDFTIDFDKANSGFDKVMADKSLRDNLLFAWGFVVEAMKASRKIDSSINKIISDKDGYSLVTVLANEANFLKVFDTTIKSNKKIEDIESIYFSSVESVIKHTKLITNN